MKKLLWLLAIFSLTTYGGIIVNPGSSGGGGGGAVWGSITGTLSSQTDLQSALNAKAPLASPTFTGTVTAPILVTGTANPATAGAHRFANAELIEWRNSSNAYNVTLGLNGSNIFALAGSPTGVTQQFTIAHASNSSGSNALLQLGVAGSSSGDPFIIFDTNGVVDWAIGSDTSDSSKWKLSKSNALGTNDYITVDTSGVVTFGTPIAANQVANVTNASNHVLTGYVSGAGTVASTDTILQAVQKLNGNIAGITSGVTTMAAVGSSPNANGASISGSTLTLQPADGSNPGVITNSTQTMGSGQKTFNGAIICSNSNFGGTACLSGASSGGQVYLGTSVSLFLAPTEVRLGTANQNSLVQFQDSFLKYGFNGRTDPNFIGGTIKSNVTAVGNTADTNADNLITFALGGADLNTNGDTVRITAYGTFAANTDNKTVICYFGGTAIATGATAILNGGSWKVDALVTRTGATTQIATADFTVDGTNQALMPAQNFYTTPGETLSGAVTIKCTGQSGAATANNIIQKGLLVEFVQKGN